MKRAFVAMVVALVCSVGVSAAEKTAKSFEIPKYGTLTLELPPEWDATLEKPSDGGPVRIKLVDKGIKDFTMVITPVNPPGDKEPATPERVRKMIDEVNTAMKLESKESLMKVEEIKGKETVGYWFALTRAQKKAAAHSHATHFRVAVGDRLILGGTIVQVHLSGPGQRQGLEILKTATIKPGEAAESK